VLVASAERARELLGWVPEHGTLHEMIGSAWQLVASGRAD
jgi:UDP-glucose 4-epimerase